MVEPAKTGTRLVDAMTATALASVTANTRLSCHDDYKFNVPWLFKLCVAVAVVHANARHGRGLVHEHQSACNQQKQYHSAVCHAGVDAGQMRDCKMRDETQQRARSSMNSKTRHLHLREGICQRITRQQLQARRCSGRASHCKLAHTKQNSLLTDTCCQ